MNDPFSERSKFFLQHREQIQEWANLEQEVHGEAHAFYMSLREPLQSRMSVSNPDAKIYSSFHRRVPPKLFLYRAHWLHEGKVPSVAVGLEWRKKPLLHNSYSGIWLRAGGDSRARAERLHPRLIEALQNTEGISLSKKGSPGSYIISNLYWPMYRYERPIGDVHTTSGLAAFHEQLLRQIEGLWSLTADVIDGVLERDEG